MNILIGCEFSGKVREAFRAKGHDAWSCDLLPTEIEGHHIQGDIFKAIYSRHWDMMIAFPPCTHLACSGAAWFEKKRADGRQQSGIDFFMGITQAPIHKICIENPVGIMSRMWREPDQIIQPYYFGDEFQKTTCLWLKNLNPLQHSAEDDWFIKKTHVGKGEFITFPSGKRMQKWYALLQADSERGKKRSVTFGGIANAMAAQWG